MPGVAASCSVGLEAKYANVFSTTPTIERVHEHSI